MSTALRPGVVTVADEYAALTDDDRATLRVARLGTVHALEVAVETLVNDRLALVAGRVERLLCERHQPASPTRQPCAACTQDATTAVYPPGGGDRG